MREPQQPQPGMRQSCGNEGSAQPQPRRDHAQLWESVLRETVSLCSADEPLCDQERRAFEDVVRKHRGRPFELDPVIIDLVAAVLQTQFNERIRMLPHWPAMIRAVAESLFEDPEMRRRLGEFWCQLSERIDRERA